MGGAEFGEGCQDALLTLSTESFFTTLVTDRKDLLFMMFRKGWTTQPGETAPTESGFGRELDVPPALGPCKNMSL